MPPAFALLTTLSAHLTTGMSILSSKKASLEDGTNNQQSKHLHFAIQLKSTNTFGRIVLKTL